MFGAVPGEILRISCPAVLLIFSGIFPKEKKNPKQTFLLAVILVSDVLFYVLDWLI